MLQILKRSPRKNKQYTGKIFQRKIQYVVKYKRPITFCRNKSIRGDSVGTGKYHEKWRGENQPSSITRSWRIHHLEILQNSHFLRTFYVGVNDPCIGLQNRGWRIIIKDSLVILYKFLVAVTTLTPDQQQSASTPPLSRRRCWDYWPLKHHLKQNWRRLLVPGGWKQLCFLKQKLL